jgi:hypothetical protein
MEEEEERRRLGQNQDAEKFFVWSLWITVSSSPFDGSIILSFIESREQTLKAFLFPHI